MKAAVVLLAVVLGATAAPASSDTLSMSGNGPALLTLRSANGDAWRCDAARVDMAGDFDDLRAVQLTSLVATATNCAQVVIQPAPAAGSSAFSQATYAASAAIGRTYITVKRIGTGSLSVVLTASGGVFPLATPLTWAAGETSAKFVLLTLLGPGTVTLRLPGSTATLTISK